MISSLLVAALVLQFVMFFKSCSSAFYAFLAVAVIHILALGTFWYDKYQSYILLDSFLQPIVAQFEGPQPMSEGLTLQNISWDGRHLTHTYLVSSRENIPSSIAVRTLSCMGQLRINALSLGAVLEHVYVLEGAQVASYSISLRTCFSNG